MAKETVTGGNSTKSAEFGYVPVTESNLFEVRAGQDACLALGQAECLEAGVRELLENAISEEGMSPGIAWLCRFAMDAALGIRNASGVRA